MSEGVCPPTEEKKEKKLSEEVGGGGCDKACNKDCWRVLWDVSPLCETARPTMASLLERRHTWTRAGEETLHWLRSHRTQN